MPGVPGPRGPVPQRVLRLGLQAGHFPGLRQAGEDRHPNHPDQSSLDACSNLKICEWSQNLSLTPRGCCTIGAGSDLNQTLEKYCDKRTKALKRHDIFILKVLF